MIRLLFASGLTRERENVREAAIGNPDVSLVGLARDGQEAVQMAVQYRPDIVVLAEDLKVLNGYEAANLVSAAAPSVKPLMLVSLETPDVIRRAMKAGVRQCIQRPASAQHMLSAALDVAAQDAAAERPEYQSALDPERFPRIIAITGAKGGVGKTSLATNLAVALSRADRGATCLVDLYTQYGDVATLLNVHARQTLVDLVNLGDDIDLDVVSTATVPHPCGLHVLLGSNAPHALDALSPDGLDRVFSALRLRYRFIVVDVPPMMYEGTLHVMENAHEVLLVCNLLDLTTVSDTARLVKAVRDTYVPRERLKLILNRVSRNNFLAIELVEKSLGLTAWAQVPNDESLVSSCTNRGTPFILDSPSHPISQSVRAIAQTIIGDARTARRPEPQPEPARQERRGLFGLFARGAGASAS